MAKTLLAVEDSKTMRRVLGITFASDDYEAVLVDSAAQALVQLDQVKPDMVLLDVTLGDASGYDLCRQVKSRLPGTPVMILSSRQQPYDPVRGAEVQADDFIDKPFDTEKIRDKVSKLCANGAAPRAAAHPTPVPARPSIPRTPPPAMPPPPAARMAPPARPAPAPAAPAPSAAASSAASVALRARLDGLQLTAAQTEAVLALSRDVVEQVVWEVVPVLAETLIKEEIARLTRE